MQITYITVVDRQVRSGILVVVGVQQEVRLRHAASVKTMGARQNMQKLNKTWYMLHKQGTNACNLYL